MPSSQDVLPQTVHQYPTKSKDAVGTIDGKVTKVACTAFTDKLMVTIMQDGRLAQWVTDPDFIIAKSTDDRVLRHSSDPGVIGESKSNLCR